MPRAVVLAAIAVVSLVVAAPMTPPAPNASAAPSELPAEVAARRPVEVVAPVPRVAMIRTRAPVSTATIVTMRRTQGVDALAAVSSGTVALTGTATATGTADLADGFRIPVATIAVDPSTYAAVLEGIDDVSSPDVQRMAALDARGVLLTTTGARLRNAATGDRLRFGDRERLVRGIVDDSLAPGSELIVHLDGAAELGLDEPTRLLVRHTLSDAEHASVAAAIHPRATGWRIDPYPREGHGSLVLSLPEIKRRFGEFAYRPRAGSRDVDIAGTFVADNIVTVAVPGLGRVTCHRAIIDDLSRALEAIIAAGEESHLRRDRYGGCFAARTIDPDGDRLSRHAWGVAIDINVDMSHPDLGPIPPQAVRDIFAAHGFRWGGDFRSPDNHHFEWVGQSATNPADSTESGPLPPATPRGVP